jgi:hypothetical protein
MRKHVLLALAAVTLATLVGGIAATSAATGSAAGPNRAAAPAKWSATRRSST